MGSNKLHRWMIGAGIGLVTSATAAIAATPNQVVNRLSEPVSLQGMSGGTVASDCGSISAQPSQQLQLTQEFAQNSGYLRFVVEGAGDPTLLIEGPTGRFCVLSDRVTNRGPEAVGYWLPGTYKIYVGDRQSQSHPYKLSILAE
jgi:hypothetical protein